jgi:hypothetical protein
MKKLFLRALIFTVITLSFSGSAFSEETVIFDFERGTESWEIPDWAYEQTDSYVGEEIESSKDVAKEGKSSLKLLANFPGGRWYGAVVEVMEFFDWTPFSKISCDIYLPEDAPRGLKAKLILTVGDNWKWTEMSRSIKLKQGKWTSISANLKPGSEDWKRTKPTDEFRADVRKIAVRIESNKAAYKGPIYIDNVVMSE